MKAPEFNLLLKKILHGALLADSTKLRYFLKHLFGTPMQLQILQLPVNCLTNLPIVFVPRSTVSRDIVERGTNASGQFLHDYLSFVSGLFLQCFDEKVLP